MRCPTDETTLVMSERNGIEIDYCPQCRGVWLDRGELDKIIDRAGAGVAPQAAPTPQQPYQQGGVDYRQGADYRQPYGQPRRKKENWLSELFD